MLFLNLLTNMFKMHSILIKMIIKYLPLVIYFDTTVKEGVKAWPGVMISTLTATFVEGKKELHNNNTVHTVHQRAPTAVSSASSDYRMIILL